MVDVDIVRTDIVNTGKYMPKFAIVAIVYGRGGAENMLVGSSKADKL